MQIMTYTIEDKCEVLAQVFDRNYAVIAEPYVSDLPLLAELFSDLSRDVMLQAVFSLRIPVRVIARLLEQSLITHDQLVAIFTQTEYSRPRIQELLQQLAEPFRQSLFDQLQAHDAAFVSMGQQINKKHTMVSGMMVHDLSAEAKSTSGALVRLKDLISRDNLDFSEYQSLISKLVTHEPDQFLPFLKEIVQKYQRFWSDPKSIISTPIEFTWIIKIGALITAAPDIKEQYSDTYFALSSRVFYSIYAMEDPMSIVHLINKLPLPMMRDMLVAVHKRTEARPSPSRDKSKRIKSHINALAEEHGFHMILSCVERYDLPYFKEDVA